MKEKSIYKVELSENIQKWLLVTLSILSIVVIVLGAIAYNHSIIMRIMMYIFIVVFIISTILIPFASISYGETKAMRQMYDLIVKDRILLIPELSAIFGLGDVYAKTLINKLISGGYLTNHTYKSQTELKKLEEITIEKK